jgi:hypothetical protein
VGHLLDPENHPENRSCVIGKASTVALAASKSSMHSLPGQVKSCFFAAQMIGGEKYQ